MKLPKKHHELSRQMFSLPVFDFLIFGKIRNLGGRGGIYATVAAKIRVEI